MLRFGTSSILLSVFVISGCGGGPLEYDGLTYEDGAISGLSQTLATEMPLGGSSVYRGVYEGEYGFVGTDEGDMTLTADFGSATAYLELDGGGAVVGNISGSNIVDRLDDPDFELSGAFYGANADAVAGDFKVGVQGGGTLEGTYLGTR